MRVCLTIRGFACSPQLRSSVFTLSLFGMKISHRQASLVVSGGAGLSQPVASAVPSPAKSKQESKGTFPHAFHNCTAGNAQNESDSIATSRPFGRCEQASMPTALSRSQPKPGSVQACDTRPIVRHSVFPLFVVMIFASHVAAP